MRKTSALARFWTVIFLFIKIFWAFYSLKFKKMWHRKSWVEAKKLELYVIEARRFRNTAVNLGGLLIKLGQFFSTRVDILPQLSIAELQDLQDEVPAVTYEQISQVIEKEFGRRPEIIFARIDENPLASASLGQVHKGRLPDGQIVAIKILRPGIDELINIDLHAIRRVIDLIKIFTDWEHFVDLDAIYEEFHVTLQAELDYIQEGGNAERIASNNKDNELLIPNIIWDYTRPRVLTMEFMEGIKINDHKALKEAGIDFPGIALKLLQTYVSQVLVDGFFHADPHPGNLFVTAQGQLVMVDFGMVGAIPAELRQQLVEMAFAMVRRDYSEVVDYLKEVGFLRYDADNAVVTRAVTLFIEHTLGRENKPSSFDLSIFLDDLEILLYEQPFQIPANFTFLGRALGTLYGLCISLDPQINFLEVAKPYLDEIGPNKTGIWEIIKDKTSLWGTSLLELPPLMLRVLSRAERGELNIRMPLQGINQAISDNTRAIRIQAWAICLGCSVFSSAYLYSKQLWDATKYSLILAGVFFLLMLFSGRKTRTRRAPHPPVLVKKERR